VARAHRPRLLLLEERVILSDINRRYKTRDVLKRRNYPRQTYAFSGIDFGDADTATRTRQKLNINGAPMVISPLPPGANATNDATWIQTYGASMDCIMSIMDGIQMADNIIETGFKWSSNSYYRGLPNANNSSLYTPVDGKQQIHFIVGKSTVPSFRETAENPILANESRSLGIRAPMQMCGWGKTITMRPTDPEPFFPRQNDQEHKLDRSTWKVGPVDFRWNDNTKMWSAFNDLIADDEGENFGTFVFSTNPDNACGFPFLRAKLEDVLSVRRTFREMGTEGAAKDDDTTKSAMLCIKLDSYTLGDNKIGSWDEVFIVADLCKQTPLEGVCGNETTKEGKLSINTTADFFASVLQSGPIVFSVIPPTDKIITGEMYYQGDGCGGSWTPGIEVDICDERTGGPAALGELYQNDQNLQDAIIEVCQLTVGGTTGNVSLLDKILEVQANLLSDINTDVKDAENSKSLSEEVSSGFGKIEEWTEDILAAITFAIFTAVSNAVGGLAGSVNDALEQMYGQLVQIIIDGDQFLITQIQACIECSMTTIEPDRTAPGIPPVIGPLDEIDGPIDLQAEIMAIDGGIATEYDVIIGEYGDLGGSVEEDVNNASETAAIDISIEVDDPCGPGSVEKSC